MKSKTKEIVIFERIKLVLLFIKSIGIRKLNHIKYSNFRRLHSNNTVRQLFFSRNPKVRELFCVIAKISGVDIYESKIWKFVQEILI